MSLTAFTIKTKQIIARIPKGNVTTYGLIAASAGNHRGARQVARILHSCSIKDELPWHRVVNRLGRLSFDEASGLDMQKALLQSEGISFTRNDTVDLDTHLWVP